MKRYKRILFICAIAAALLLLGWFFLNREYKYFMRSAYPLKYSDIVAKEATKNHLDPAMVYSVIKAESNFDPDAKSRAGAIGLMQLTPDTFDWLQTKLKSDEKYTENNLYSPEINIRYGCKFLSILFNKYSKQATALCAYNAGIGTVNAWLKDPDISKDGVTLDQIPFEETRNYVNIVLKNYENYKKTYQFNDKGESVND
ncbi:lytic transglycosylase domain-containing protein [Caproiciproducens galactitolivorans]|uniref:Soluble lytic murein transglycosylase n=1 Tax=Caproiciproducens galactitolivorans TaxID=642589 RepID=A0A4Z0XXE5_9FIRM|nr:lytic transglycosylase domain-containing protein [Caproiciproducens galactitolivorans]QEY33915.1 lytic transglycosylase domain-containing protein [Caproiciproducens galactitolivorans]TGJ76124.1 soluble lytic murein transglycosylase precursor [Caproiciproducens galactitolivorans]